MDLGYSDSDSEDRLDEVVDIQEKNAENNTEISSSTKKETVPSFSRGMFSSLPPPKNVQTSSATDHVRHLSQEETNIQISSKTAPIRPPPGMLHKSQRTVSQPQTQVPVAQLTAEKLKTMLNPHDKRLMKELDHMEIVDVVPFQREDPQESTQSELQRLGSISAALTSSSKGQALLTTQVSRVARKRHHIHSMALDAAANELEILDKQRKSAQIRKISSSRYGW